MTAPVNAGGVCRFCARETLLHLCWDCSKKLRAELNEFPWLLGRLRESAYGEAKTSRGGAPVRTSDVSSLSFNERATQLIADASSRLGECVRQLVADESCEAPAAARILATRVGELMGWEYAGDALRWAQQWRADAEKCIDLPPDREYAGQCPTITYVEVRPFDKRDDAFPVVKVPDGPCGHRLYCLRGDDTVTCPRCASVHSVVLLQDDMMQRVDEQLRTQAEMWRLLKWIGRDVPRSSFYHLVAGKVQCRAYRWSTGVVRDVEPTKLGVSAQPLYAYSDVVAALDAWEAEKAERKARRGRPRKVDTPPDQPE